MKTFGYPVQKIQGVQIENPPSIKEAHKNMTHTSYFALNLEHPASVLIENQVQDEQTLKQINKSQKRVANNLWIQTWKRSVQHRGCKNGLILPHCCWAPSRGPKSLNFPDGNFQRAKTFRTKCINRFRDKKTRKSFSRQKKGA